MTVLEQSVRDLMDNIAASHLLAASINANIARFKRIVDDVKDPLETDTDKIDDAIRAGAVWLSYGTYVEGMSQNLGIVPPMAKQKLDHYRSVAELFLNRISKERIDLDKDGNELIGVPPEVMGLTTTEGYYQ